MSPIGRDEAPASDYDPAMWLCDRGGGGQAAGGSSRSAAGDGGSAAEAAAAVTAPSRAFAETADDEFEGVE